MNIKSSENAVPTGAYMPMEGQMENQSRVHNVLHVIFGFIIAALLITVIVLAVHNDDDSTTVEVEFTREGMESSVDAGSFYAFLSVESTNVTVSSVSVAKDHLGRALYQVEGYMPVTYTLRNDAKTALFIVIKQTPLDEGDNDQPLDNFLGLSSHLYYNGIITEEGGTFETFQRIEAGATIAATLDIASTTVVAATKGIVQLVYTHSIYVHDPSGDHVKSFIINTNEIDLEVTQAEGIPINATAPQASSRSTEFSSVKQTSSSDTYSNVPYWDYVCADDESLHGYTYSSGASQGEKVPCSVLAPNYCTQVSGACPVSCDACPSSSNMPWSKPYSPKTYTTSGCSSTSHAYWKSEDLLATAEDGKGELCAATLFCLQNPSAGTCDALVTTWFGPTSSSANMETLREGFTKMCSSDQYQYTCNPTSNCQITFTYDGVRYTNANQDSIEAAVQKGFVTQCQEQGCSYSATIAWVRSSSTSPREINLCPMGFWIMKDSYGSDTGSKTNTILHELSHFTDLAGTSDIEYNNNAQKAYAVSNPWVWINNADNWGNMADSAFVTGGSHEWSAFATGDVPIAPAPSPGTCTSTDNGATDDYGDGCSVYESNPNWCSGYDTATFNSGTMCCICGGGSTA